MIYRSIQLRNHKTFLDSTIHTSSAFRDLHLKSVIHLKLFYACSIADANAIIQACPRLNSVEYGNLWLLTTIPPSIKRISTTYPSFLHSLRSEHITHMELTNPFLRITALNFNGFTSFFPSLTHLSLDLSRQPLRRKWEDLKPYLPPPLLVIIFFISSEDWTDRSALESAIKGEMDGRVVVEVRLPCQELLDVAKSLFISGAEGVDRWSHARRIIDRREKQGPRDFGEPSSISLRPR